jgi:NAD(P)-dependent dehydrogenase (short-subunit alcohol dehydrogenase family)
MTLSKSDDKPVTMIVGATGGIGSALTARLAGEGHRLAVSARHPETLHALASSHGALALPLDATDFEAVSSGFRSAREHFGQVTGAALCVGSILLKPAHLTSLVEWEETVRLNLTSAFAVVRASAETMRSTGGSVVLMSSAAARIGLANHEAIAAAKAGVTGLARSAAATYASRGIRFNSVAPGLVQTPLAEGITGNEKALQASRALHPLGRIGEPGEVADLIAWLLSDRSRWVTGQEFGIDGGLGTVRAQGR